MTDTARISQAERVLSREAEAARDLVALIGASDDEALAHDMIEGETDLHGAIASALDMLDQTEALAEGIKALMARYADRKAATERRAERIRGGIQQAMAMAGLRTVQLPAATVSLKAVAPKPIIEDESLIPAEFWTPQAPKLDRAALTKAAKAAAIPGVAMSNGGESLQIRRT